MKKIVLSCECEIENAEAVVRNLGLEGVQMLIGRLLYCFHCRQNSKVVRVE